MNWINRYSIVLLMVISTHAAAGKITVSTSEPGAEKVDPFALKRALVADDEWRRQLPANAALNWKKSLPSGCVVVAGKRPHFICGPQFFRSYQFGDQRLYIEVDGDTLSPR